MDLELDLASTQGGATPQIFTLNATCMKISMKVCPSVKKWTCTGCTTNCTIMCVAQDA